MNFQDFFRSFIGLHQRGPYRDERYSDDPVNKFKNPPWADDPDEDDDFDELYSDYRSRKPQNDFGFNLFTGDLMEMHKYFEQQMNDMMKSFGSFGMGAFDFPEGNLREETDSTDAPRNRYLKPGLGDPRYSNTISKTDSDLDHRIKSEGIGALFKKEEQEPVVPVKPKTFSRSFTSRIITYQDGKVEEKVKEWRSDGCEKETVRRRIGDESHSITTSTDSSGQLVQQEELVNIDQDSLVDFNKKWSSGLRGRSSLLKTPQENNTAVAESSHSEVSNSASTLLSSLWKLFS